MSHAPLVQMRQCASQVVEQSCGLIAGQAAASPQHDRQIGPDDELAEHTHAALRQRDHPAHSRDRLMAQQSQVGQAAQNSSLSGASVHDVKHDVIPGSVQCPPRSEMARAITPHRLADGQPRGHELVAHLHGEVCVLGGWALIIT